MEKIEENELKEIARKTWEAVSEILPKGNEIKIGNELYVKKKASTEMEEFLLEIEAFKKKMQELEFTYKEVAELTKEFIKARAPELPKYCNLKV
ncbi:hypothetical protein [Fusobacterium necrophorum]|uniref:hypothetical protein n=1 Tax=Fusobacterium necrophorum TaxID=859 RepID=UPI00370E1407